MITKTTLITLLITFSIIAADIVAAGNSKIVVLPVEATDKSLEEGSAIIDEIISEYFKDNRAVSIISNDHKEALTGADTGNRLQLIKTVTANMESDQALIFSLVRYRERVGDHLSVKDPASLAFEFKLIRAEDGRATCSGRFDETQKSLTENILDLPRNAKRGFRWLTVKEMAVEAVRERFDTCPALIGNPAQ